MNKFTKLFYKVPLLLLSAIVFLPIILIEVSPSIWAGIVFTVCLFYTGWLFSIVKLLFKKNKYDVALKIQFFFIRLFFLVFYIGFLSIHFAISYDNYDEPMWLIGLIVIGHFIMLYSYVSLIKFTAQLVSTIELKRVVTFNDYGKHFFLLFIFPIGIWWIYQKIINLIKE
jgi:hypothetical protein